MTSEVEKTTDAVQAADPKKRVPKKPHPTVARDILKEGHPLHKSFNRWLAARPNGPATATLRKARAFLAQYLKRGDKPFREAPRINFDRY